MDVFEAFPEAIIGGEWQLGEVKRATVRGKKFGNPVTLKVIVDEGTYAVTDRSPSAEYETSDTLIYARASDLPTLDTAKLAANYLWYNLKTNGYFNIREANLGKNQDTGAIEHVEFLIRPTEALDE